jgi:hypothetical protein
LHGLAQSLLLLLDLLQDRRGLLGRALFDLRLEPLIAHVHGLYCNSRADTLYQLGEGSRRLQGRVADDPGVVVDGLADAPDQGRLRLARRLQGEALIPPGQVAHEPRPDRLVHEH